MTTINELQQNELRKLREDICFSVINRGKLWYEKLSSLQIGELRQWYDDWLNVTKTGVIPNTPKWLNDTLVEEDEI